MPAPSLLRAAWITSLVGTLLSAGCGDDAGGLLLVDLKSDLVSGTEVSFVDVNLTMAGAAGPGVDVTTPLTTGLDLLSGYRIAELRADAGTHLLTVSLRASDDSEVLRRTVALEISGSTGVTVIATRSCRGVTCGEDATCVAGSCVDPRCTPETPERCPPPQCAVVADCPAAPTECLARSCEGGVCYELPDDGLCAPEESCSPDLGCVTPPSTAPPLMGATGLSAGASHICAKTEAGVRCWGNNQRGQLGDGTTTKRPTPGPLVAMTTPVYDVVTGDAFTCAHTESGILCWGDNSAGQLGQDAPAQSAVPIAIPDLEGLLSAPLGAGASHMCAWAHPSTCPGPGPCIENAMCWGLNGNGQLGDGTLVSRSSPAPAIIGDMASSITAGNTHTCVAGFLDSYCWGDNSLGQLGVGDTMGRLSPVVVGDFGEPYALAAGWAHSCIATRDGVLSCWGDNSAGQLGLGRIGGFETSPVATPLANVRALALGARHSCALVADGSVWCWGNNDKGQLGLGTLSPAMAPEQVPLGEPAQDLTAGDEFTCVTVAAGEVLCWGANADGQLGDGTMVDRATPTLVLDPSAG